MWIEESTIFAEGANMKMRQMRNPTLQKHGR